MAPPDLLPRRQAPCRRDFSGGALVRIVTVSPSVVITLIANRPDGHAEVISEIVPIEGALGAGQLLRREQEPLHFPLRQVCQQPPSHGCNSSSHAPITCGVSASPRRAARH
jgi:hypothetical protein